MEKEDMKIIPPEGFRFPLLWEVSHIIIGPFSGSDSYAFPDFTSFDWLIL